MAREEDDKHGLNWCFGTTATTKNANDVWGGFMGQEGSYMCHEGVVDGGLWVSGPARLHRLPLPFPLPLLLALALDLTLCLGVRHHRLALVVLEAWDGSLLRGGVVQDSCHTQLHLEVQKVIPGVFEEQILYGKKEDKRNTKKKSQTLR